MRTAFLRGLAAILATLAFVGCGPQPKAYTAKTPEELQQLTEVTDRVLLLAQSAEPGAALRDAIAALNAADRQYRQHGEAIVTRDNADAIACIHSRAMEILDLEMIVARRDEAARRQDEAAAKRRNAMLIHEAMDVFQCVIVSTDLLIDREQRPEALKHGAVLISEIYAVAAILRAAAGLPPATLLKDQIRTYEKIAAKLGPKHEVQVITDALPKLKAALASVEESPAP